MTFTPAQCRAARGLLYWSQEDLVAHSKITKKTIADFERGMTHPRRQTLDQIIAAFEAAGVEFLNHDQPGVRFNTQMADYLKASVADEIGTGRRWITST